MDEAPRSDRVVGCRREQVATGTKVLTDRAERLQERADRRLVLWLLAGLIPLLAGCQGMSNARALRKTPQYGLIDPGQPRELQMT